MSLINDVLKNLQHRQSPLGQENVGVLFGSSSQTSHKRRGYYWLLVVVVAIGLLLTAVYAYWWKPHLQAMMMAHKKQAMMARFAKPGGEKPLAAITAKQSPAEKMVTLANPPLQPQANAALPPPPDLQDQVAARAQLNDKKALAGPAKPAAAVAPTLTVPATALQNASASSSPDDGFSLVPVTGNVQDSQLLNVEQLLKTGHLEEAESVFNGLPSDLDPEKKLILQAQLLSARQQNKPAIALLEAYNKEHTPSVDNLGQLALMYDLVGDYSASVSLYKKLVDFWPDSAKWWLGLAIASMHKGEYSQAITAFERVLNHSDQLPPEVLSYVQVKVRMLTTDHPTYY